MKRAGLVGQVFAARRRLCAASVQAYCEVSGDRNPIHFEGGAGPGLAGPIVPGMLAASLFSALIAHHLPGALYLGQTLRFPAPIPVGERVTVEVVVEAERPMRGRLRLQLSTTIRRSDAVVAVRGEADVLV